ncbi:MAG: hypothetical protein WC511_01265 [Candidatus Pacearchaeota archaeon]|jgi:hypothetical protein
MDEITYPSFQWVEPRGAFFLNAQLPRNYEKIIPKFYESNGKEKLEDIANKISNSMETVFGKDEIKLQWDETKGLTQISIGLSGGAYLERYSFIEHNLGTKTTFMTGAIIINYINELLNLK